MRFRSRYLAFAIASVAALAVSGVASASHISNTSSLPTWTVAPSALPGSGGGGNGGSGTTAAVALTVQTATVFAHPGDASLGGKTKTVTLLFDNDVVINLQGIPACNATFTAGTTIAQAWERCGPGADTAPEVNAYLSPATAVSGTVSTAPPSNFPGCTLVFKRSASSVLLFSRVALIQNGAPNCANPATNTAGNTSTILTGNLSNVSTTDFKTKLNVPNIDQLPLPLDNFKAKLKRASVFKARCKDNNKLLNLRGTFAYSNDGAGGNPNQPNDVVNKTKACT
jgi:hypothetical protein